VPDHLLVFVKEPRPGAVKSRLAAALGPHLAAAVYKSLAEHVLSRTAPRGDEYEQRLFFAPATAAAAIAAWLPSVTALATGRALVPQVDGDLGTRMCSAFEEAFGRGARRVALIGTDVPSLDREDVIGSFEDLDHHDVVLGPATDGGYSLIALKAAAPGLFRDVPWSTPRVLEVTLERAARRDLSVRLLRTLGDVDTVEDLAADWARIRALLPDAIRAEVATRLGRVEG